jgi:FtsP/CotA-like multicopper oxidase with cupredoxin domain
MNKKTMKQMFSSTPLILAALIVAVFSATAYSAAPGITGPTFNLTAQAAYITQPDGASIYSWGYGCNSAPSGFAPANIAPSVPAATKCPTMQIPGPTLIVTQGQTVTVNLANNLPAAAGNTSILFPGFNVTTSGGVVGPLTREAAPVGGTVQYTFIASTPGTRAYYSGTQGDLQIEMGLYGAIIVLPSSIPGACTTGVAAQNLLAKANWGEPDYRLAAAAYNHPKACYDREYMFQFSEIDPTIHRKAEEQVTAKSGCTAGSVGCRLNVPTEPYVPAYFLINGRSMPDLMDGNYDYQYPHQPYNGNPHLHPGELVLLRILGQGRWQHPFHEHGNHVRVLARDGNLILSSTNANEQNLAGPLLFTTTTTPGQAMDGIYYWTGKGLNWDAYGHNPQSSDPNATLPCDPDSNGYNTSHPTAINYYEWCQDHNKPLQATPTGDVAGGGPATLPDPNILANGAWFGGSPYLGANATVRAVGSTGTTPPSGTVANSPTDEAGFAFMWHSHNEREITTNNIFPGGAMMMMLVDSREFVIDESK